jgi:hypothetical protein
MNNSENNITQQENISQDNNKHSSTSFNNTLNTKVSDEDVTKLIVATIRIQRVWRRYIDLQGTNFIYSYINKMQIFLIYF